MISEVLNDASISLNDISCVAVCGGPGSYTGLRIALSTAKAICYVLDKPLILDNRIELLATQSFNNSSGLPDVYLVMLYAREKEYFIGVYDTIFNCITQPKHVLENNLIELIKPEWNLCIVSDVAEEKIKEKIKNKILLNPNINIDINHWATHAFKKYKQNLTTNISDAEPIYLKETYIISA